MSYQRFDVGVVKDSPYIRPIDINSDGLMDFAISMTSMAAHLNDPSEIAYSKLRIFIQGENFSLRDATDEYINGTPSILLGSDLELADFNGDGVTDFALAGSGIDPYDFGSDGVRATDLAPGNEYGEPDVYYLSNEKGFWKSEFFNNEIAWTHNIAIGDINKDGLDDVFSSSIAGDRSFFNLSSSTGGPTTSRDNLPISLVGYTPPHEYIDPNGDTKFSISDYTAATLTDVNGDKFEDLILLAGVKSKESFILLNNGQGDFSNSTEISLPESAFGPGGFIDERAFSDPSDESYAGTVNLEAIAADIDYDGDPDLVVLSTRGNSFDLNDAYRGTGVQILENDGTGQFSLRQEIILDYENAYVQHGNFELLDFERDGDLDIILHSRGTASINTPENMIEVDTQILIFDDGAFRIDPGIGALASRPDFVPFYQNGELHFLEYEFVIYGGRDDGLGLFEFGVEITKPAIESFNQIASSGDAEYLAGGPGDEVFLASRGFDVVDGAGGIDRVSFMQPMDENVLTLTNTQVRYSNKFDFAVKGVLKDVEIIEFSDASLDLGSITGATSLSGDALESLLELYIAYFNRAPDALGLNFWGTAFADGLSLDEIAAQFAPQPETLATYPEGTSNTEFATAVYNNVLGRAPDQAGLDFWVGALDSEGVSRDQFILAILRGVEDGSADRAYLDNKVDVGAYFAVHKGMSDVSNAQAAMALYDGTASSIDAAVSAIDGFYQTALDPVDGEFLLQVVGVLDNMLGG